MQQIQEELLTVIVPVYNIENYLKRCVASLTAQTYQNLEIILVDDGSTDNSLQIGRELAQADKRIRVIHKENGGSSSARNRGLEEARGSYIGFVDSDDYVEPDMYEALYLAVQKNRVLMAQCARDDIDEQGNELPQVCKPPAVETVSGPEEFLRELLLHKGDASFCTKLTHRSLFLLARFPEGELNEDFHLLLKLLPHIGQGICCTPKLGYHVFYKLGSNTRTIGRHSFSRVYADNVNNADLAEELAARCYPALTPVARRFGLYQRLEYLLHVPIADMNRKNGFYRKAVRHLRKNLLHVPANRWLGGKDKCYLLILSAFPGAARRLHCRWMLFRDR